MPNFWGDDDGADAHCVRCEAKIYFDVGWGGSDCPACGEPWEKTDEQLAKERAEQQALAEKQSKPGYWFEDMARHLDSEVMWLDMMFIEDSDPYGLMPPGVAAKAAWLRGELKRLVAELRKG